MVVANHTPDIHLLTFLWFAANKCCIRDISERFGIGSTSAFRVIRRVMNFLLAIAPSVIKFPSNTREKEKAALDFAKIAEFPNTLGCIDGTFKPVRTPAHKVKSTYVNRHDIPSITLQGICNSQKRFIDVFTGPPGKVHDSRILSLSFISKNLRQICETRKYHIIGDSGIPVTGMAVKRPYRDYGHLTAPQKKFNYKLCATRVKIENAFGF